MRDGMFIAEGSVVVGMLLRSDRFRARSVFVLENRLDGFLARHGERLGEVPLLVASRTVMDTVAGFPMHRGILAIGEPVAPDETVGALTAGLPGNATVVVAIGISNHDNIGAIFRNAAAFGVDAVLLDGSCCDPLYRKAIRVSAGGIFRVPYARAQSADALLGTLARSGFRLLSMTPSADRNAFDVEAKGRMALIVGTEGDGLPKDIIDATEPVRIPMTPGTDSINVATAAAVLLSSIYARRS